MADAAGMGPVRTITVPARLPPPAATRAAAPATAKRRRLRLGTTYARQVAGATLLGLAARAVLLGHQVLWRDEAFTLLTSRRSWLGTFDVVRHDSAPPLAYVLTHLAVLVSSDPIALRLTAALAGAAGVPVAAALGRRAAGDRGGVFAALFFAVMPTTVLSARDARMYALAGVLAMTAMLAVWRAVERPSRGRLLAVTAAAGAALMTQYLTALVLVATLLALPVTLRPPRRTLARVGAAMTAGIIPLAVWLPFATPQLQHASSPFWVHPISFDAALGVLTQFAAGPAVDPWVPARGLLFVFQALAMFFGAICLLRLLGALPGMTSERRRGLAYVAGGSLGAMILLLLVSLRTALLDARYTSVMWDPCVAMLGVGLSMLRPRAVGAASLGVLAATAGMLAAEPGRADVPALAQLLRGRVHGRDVVLADPDLYFQALVSLDPAAAARTHIPQDRIEWYWGVAAFPPGALMPAVPAGAGTVYVLDHPAGETAAEISQPRVSLPPGYHRTGSVCAVGACLEVFTR